jgi:enoyl-CoA hydratase
VDLGTTKMIARKEGGIGWMIFNQPEKHNAVSLEMWAAVPKIVAAFEADADVRVIVLAGAGERAFVSGADISEFENKRDSEKAIGAYDAVSEEAHASLARALKPTVAMIRGICFGGGVGIALTTDVRICSSDARFSVPAAKLGVG